MSRTFGQWLRFMAACVIAGFMVSAVCASMGVSSEEARNQVRMSVDFTVLPVVLPDGSEAPPPAADPDAMQGESTLPPDSTGSEQAAVHPEPAPPAPEPAAQEKTPEPAAEPEKAATPAPKTAPASPAGPGIIKTVRLTEKGDGFTLTLTADRPVGDTSFLNLDDPRRLVIDLASPWTLKTRNVVRSKGAIKHIVFGEHPDKLRMVIHFNTPPKVQLKPVFTRSGTTLSIAVALH